VVSAEPCGSLRVSTVETDRVVELTVRQLNPPGDSCIGSLSPEVTLSRPLGDRTVVDAGG
jgi:hypothetical protein